MNLDTASKGIGMGIGIAAMGAGLGIAFDALKGINKQSKKKTSFVSYSMPKIQPIKKFKW